MRIRPTTQRTTHTHTLTHKSQLNGQLFYHPIILLAKYTRFACIKYSSALCNVCIVEMEHDAQIVYRSSCYFCFAGWKEVMFLRLISNCISKQFKWKLGKRSTSKGVKSFQSPAEPFDIWMVRFDNANANQLLLCERKTRSASFSFNANGPKTWHYSALLMADTFQTVVHSSSQFCFESLYTNWYLSFGESYFSRYHSVFLFTHMATVCFVRNIKQTQRFRPFDRALQNEYHQFNIISVIRSQFFTLQRFD